MTTLNHTPITATLIKALRDKTGVGVIACKQALTETHGDLDAAADLLRAAEAAKAAAKANRVAAEGLVGLVVHGLSGAVVELNCETDFVARTPAFQDAVTGFAAVALAVKGDYDALLNAPAPDGDGSVADAITRLTTKTGERVHLRRSGFVSVSRGLVASYVHNVAAAGLGCIGVLVALQSTGEAAALREIGHRLAMHIAASSPNWVSRDDIPAEVIAEKRGALSEEARMTGKSPAIVEKMIDGRLRKFYEETVLELQPFVLNPDQRVADARREAETACGAAIRVAAFVRFQTGEGLETPAASG